MLDLQSYDFSYLRERYADEHPEYANRFDEAVDGLRKFLAIPAATGIFGPLAAMSHAVDGLWHTFINHTPQYAEFCKDVYGGSFLHHQPRSEKFPVSPKAISNFYTLYPKVHGEPVPDIWFEDIPPAHIAAVALGQVPPAVQQLKWSGWPGW